MECLKELFHSDASDQTQFVFDFILDLGSPVTFHFKQIQDYNRADKWCRTCVFKTAIGFLFITSQESLLASQLFHYSMQLCSVNQVSVVRKQTNF